MYTHDLSCTVKSFATENPVENYFLLVDGLKDRKERAQVMKVTQPLLDALGRRYCIYAEGTAFYALQSCLNHRQVFGGLLA